MYPVGIIGGGPVGLSAALCLAQQGIKSILIEKHPTTTNHPKARGVNGRTMEIFRSFGLQEKMLKYQLPLEALRFTWIEDFQGKEITRVQADVDYSRYSPTSRAVIAQDCVEKELFEKAQGEELIDLRFDTEMRQVNQDEERVEVEIRDKKSGKTESFTCLYLIAADGANSTLRERFGIEMEGEADLGSFCNIYCEMDLDKYVKDRPSVGFMFTRPDLRGTFMLSKDGLRKWLVGVRIGTNTSLTKEAFTEDAFCVDYVKKIVNDPAVEVKLINKAFWTMAALIAKQYRIGRVFFAGDAAHRLPPTGGFGMNTGIQDAHNLAWKLAMVIQEKADSSFLDTYFTERVQIAKTNTNWSMTNAKRFSRIYEALAKNDIPAFEDALKDQNHHLNNIQLDLGFVYGKDYQTQSAFIPSAEVGARAPHCWLKRGDEQLSTLDLYKNQFVLVCSPNALHWQEQYRQFSFPIVTIGPGGEYQDIHHDFLETYGISQTGAVLVRPDGHVAWRAKNEDWPIAKLRAVWL